MYTWACGLLAKCLESWYQFSRCSLFLFPLSFFLSLFYPPIRDSCISFSAYSLFSLYSYAPMSLFLFLTSLSFISTQTLSFSLPMLSSSFWTTCMSYIFLSLFIQSSLFLCLCALPLSEPPMRTKYFFPSLFNPFFFFTYALFLFLNHIYALHISFFFSLILSFSLNYSILSLYLPLSVQYLSYSLPTFYPLSYQRTRAYTSVSLYLISLFSLSMLTLSLYALVLCPSIFYLCLVCLSFCLSFHACALAFLCSVWPLCLFSVSLCFPLHWCSPVFLAIPGVWRHPARWQGHPDHRLPSHQVRLLNIYCSANLGLYHRTFLLSLCQVRAFNNKTFLYPLYRLLMSLTLIKCNHHNCTLWWSPKVQSLFTVDSGKSP